MSWTSFEIVDLWVSLRIFLSFHGTTINEPGLEIQLKILQALPSLLQNYALTGALLAVALHTCFLLHGSKTAVVSNTAAATLQQAAVLILGKVAQEDGPTLPLHFLNSY